MRALSRLRTQVDYLRHHLAFREQPLATTRFGSDGIAAALESFGYGFYRCSPAGQLIELVSPPAGGNLVAHVPDTV